MPTYQKALEYAHNKHYPESIEQLHLTIEEVEKSIGKYTNMHLYLY